jgi:hypothetical protein
MGSAVGQTYPRWFLDQAQVVPGAYVGYARLGYFRDSAVAYALHNACENAARQQSIHVSGSREHWATEIGNIVMTDAVREEFDTSRVNALIATLTVVDSAFRGEMVLVLATENGVQLSTAARGKIPVSPDSMPSWVSTPPHDDEYLYASGLAPGYFYEMSSWLEAERVARKNLALLVYTKVQSVQRVAEQGIEKSREEVEVTLNDVQLVARWRDIRNNVMHVLVRMRE